MKSLLVSLILFCVGLHCSFGAETVFRKASGEWLIGVFEDPFTKNRAAVIAMKQRNKTSPTFGINANQTGLDDEGKLVATNFLTFVGLYPSGDKIGSGKNMKIRGILVDGSSMETEGETWKKDLIAAMLKGEKIIIRIAEEMPKGLQVATISTPLEGFAECWNAIPKELIDLEIPSVVSEPANPPPVTNSIANNFKWIFRFNNGWEEGVVVAYDTTTGFGAKVLSGQCSDTNWVEDRQGTLDQSQVGRLYEFSRNRYHELTKSVLEVKARKQKAGFPITAVAPQLSKLHVRPRTWVNKNGKWIEGVLLSYESESAVATVKVAGRPYVRIKRDSLRSRCQTYLDVVAKYTPNGMPLRFRGYPVKKLTETPEKSALGTRQVPERTKWVEDKLFVAAMNRTWSSASDDGDFEGVVVGFYGSDRIVKLKRKSDRKAFTVKASTLSREDAQYLAHVYRHMSDGAALKVVEP